FPQWAWAILGTLAAAIAWRLLRQFTRFTRAPILLLALWLLATLYFADDFVPMIRGLVHGFAPSGRARQGTIRIVTLNCASSASAAGEVMKFQPDIVLLQEGPASNKVAELAHGWFADSASLVAGL